MEKRRVYIAGALNASNAILYLQNVSRMMEWANAVMDSGYAVFVPALDLLMCIKFGDYDYEKVFQNSQPFLAVCDAVFLVPQHEASPGTQREIAYAKSLGIPVFDSLMTLDDYFKA